jgi:hypothetical protein
LFRRCSLSDTDAELLDPSEPAHTEILQRPKPRVLRSGKAKDGHASEPKHSLELLEQIELISKIAAGVVALTYVSGYLVETTFLGTFGLRGDAIEFFRAKYLYIGFHFWFCVSILVVLLLIVKRVFEFSRSLQRRMETRGDSEVYPRTVSR